jgi:hypothetical protein
MSEIILKYAYECLGERSVFHTSLNDNVTFVFWRKLSHQDVVFVIIKIWNIKVPNSNNHKLCFILNMHIKSYNILEYFVPVLV